MIEWVWVGEEGKKKKGMDRALSHLTETKHSLMGERMRLV